MKVKYSSCSPAYHLKHITWNGIEYDKDKLISLVERISYLEKNKKKEGKEELEILNQIFNSHNRVNLHKLLSNDPEYSRWAIIEKYARKATTEVLLNGKYSEETFNIISNLPTSDYRLIIRRSKELIKIINETIAEAEMDTSKIPGVK